MNLGLRIDVDTLRGTKQGVPNLCRLLAKKAVRASFFFSVGPDNMGRHIRRLIRPSFLIKMLRTRAASLYGWDILFKGTFWPGPVIGERAAVSIRSAAGEGHEIGLHAWDHHAWQTHIEKMSPKAIRRSLQQGVDRLTQITGKLPSCSAAPAWKCNDLVLKEKCRFPFTYNSDCRGVSIFYPIVENKQLLQAQIPVTLPTYDEVIGRNSVTDRNYNDYILSLLKSEKLNVLTIHAEVEGIVRLEMFQNFMDMAIAKGISFVPLSTFLKSSESFDRAALISSEIAGRDGWVSCQASAHSSAKRVNL